jgi:hypothetical protein
MKNSLLKFAGLFVEKVPVDDPARPGGRAGSVHPAALQGHFPSASGTVARPPGQQQPAAGAANGAGAGAAPVPQRPLAVALRAWVPQEYAVYLASYGLHVIAAGGELTVEQAGQWGAQVLVVSAECLGSHTHLLTAPQLPTVFVTPQTMMIPEVQGVVQVQEPLRASEVATAAREAANAWAAARRGM